MGSVVQESSSYDEKKLRLKELIREYGIVFRDVQLFSKISSPYYYDIKKVGFQHEGMHLLGELLLTEVTKYGANSVGGMEMGAIALVSAIVLKSTTNGRYDNGLGGFFIRREPKSYGLQKRIEGNLVPPVAIVDDVITTGRSVIDSIDAVNKEGVELKGVICVIDREEGIPNLLEQHNIKYSSLFKHSDFKEFIEEKLSE